MRLFYFVARRDEFADRRERVARFAALPLTVGELKITRRNVVEIRVTENVFKRVFFIHVFCAATDDEEGNLYWQWSEDVDWKPKVRMTMSSEVANRYFQGKENVAMALARRRIKSGGDVKAALSLIPITKPIYARYREFLEAEHPHLKV